MTSQNDPSNQSDSYNNPDTSNNTIVVEPTNSKSNTKNNSDLNSNPNYSFRTLSLLLLGISLLIIFLATFLVIYPSKSRQLLDKLGLKVNQSSMNSNDSSDNSEQQFEQDNKMTGPFNFSTDQGAKSTSTVIDESLPSILSIRVKTQTGKQNIASESAGTGYFASEDGLVVTNRHVISQACRATSFNQITITGLTKSQKAYQLEVLSIDPIDDIAILRVKNPSETFKPVRFADPSQLKLGSDVIAIGNVLGEFSNTVTKGIVSGVDRTLETNLTDNCTGRQITSDGLIQTDAAINQGNSGGPLFDAAGNVIGMNTFGTSEGQNIGFAIPSSIIVSDLNSYKQNTKITRPLLGVATTTIDPARKVENDWLPVDYGEIIFNEAGTSVSPNSAAEKSGIKEGDIILEVNGRKLVSASDNTSPLRREILSKQPNQEIELTILKSLPNPNNENFTYLPTQEKVKVKLGETSFDLLNNTNR